MLKTDWIYGLNKIKAGQLKNPLDKRNDSQARARSVTLLLYDHSDDHLEEICGDMKDRKVGIKRIGNASFGSPLFYPECGESKMRHMTVVWL